MTPTDTDTTYGLYQLADRIGLYRGELVWAVDIGVVPGPDADGRWSEALATSLAGRRDELRAQLEDRRPLGATRCAALLAAATGLPVQPDDINDYAVRGKIAIVDRYKSYPLFDVQQVLALVDDPDLPGIVANREQWLEASLDVYAAAERVGWHPNDLLGAAAEFGVHPGWFGRISIGDLDRLATDDAFQARRPLGPDQAAARLDIRRVDFDYAVAAGWIDVASYVQRPVGRRSTVTVPLYRAGDVDALLDIPGVDWHAVRTVTRGAPSPLREFARRPPSRAQIIRRIAADLGTRFEVETWAFYNGRSWEIDWETVGDRPTRAMMVDALNEDPTAKPHLNGIVLSTSAGAAVNWARAMLEPGAAVILDTETTTLHGAIVEIAVIDACTGKPLLNTLVRADQPIEPEAHAIHGIADTDLVDAPTWSAVLPKLLRITRKRTVLAYNADYDHYVVTADTERAGLKLRHLADPDRWGCIMIRRSDWTRCARWLPLGGGHRALGDTQEARKRLLEMTAPAGTTPRR